MTATVYECVNCGAVVDRCDKCPTCGGALIPK